MSKHAMRHHILSVDEVLGPLRTFRTHLQHCYQEATRQRTAFTASALLAWVHSREGHDTSLHALAQAALAHHPGEVGMALHALLLAQSLRAEAVVLAAARIEGDARFLSAAAQRRIRDRFAAEAVLLSERARAQAGVATLESMAVAALLN